MNSKLLLGTIIGLFCLFGLIILLFAGSPGRNTTGTSSVDETFEWHSLEDFDPSAKCNDGTPAGMWISKDVDLTASSRWLIMLEGGEYCFDSHSCTDRSIRLEGRVTSAGASTLPFPSDGILSSLEEDNPYWYDANRVYLHYCSSDLWMGTRSATESDIIVDGKAWAFLGNLLLTRSLEYLQTLQERNGGLSEATEVLFGGLSAGAVGVAASLPIHAELLEEAAPRATVSYILDSGWLVDVEEDHRLAPVGSCSIATNCSLRVIASSVVSAWDAQLPSTCPSTSEDEEDLWTCFYGSYIWASLPQSIVESAYIIELQYDPINLGENGLAHVPETDEELTFAAFIAQTILTELEDANVAGSFSSACFRKAGIVNSPGWNTNAIQDMSMAEAHQNWYQALLLTSDDTITDTDDSSFIHWEALQLADECGVDSLEELMCNPTCPDCLCERRLAFSDDQSHLLYEPV